MACLLDQARAAVKIKNLCRPCDIDLASVAAFDRHRVGRHDLDYPEHENGRRCLRLDEFEAAGLTLDKNGRYHLAAKAAQIREWRERQT